jgi:DnaJ-class molecular chaperone
MEVINYYYQILELKYNATEKEINESYNNKIKKYLNLPFLNDNQKVEIKELKKAKFILGNTDLREKYDSIIFQEIEENNKIKEKDTLNKKEKLDSEMMGNRIFSMIGIITPPQRNYDIDRNFASIK